jgi:DivIVA domain-containing protein
MTIEPVEIQHVKLRKRAFGYDPNEVERLLEDVTTSFEQVWLERDALRRQVEQLQSMCDQSRAGEREVSQALLFVEQIAEKRRIEAMKSAAETLAEARDEAAQILADTELELQRHRDEIDRLETMERALRERYRAFVSSAQRLLGEAFVSSAQRLLGERLEESNSGFVDAADRVSASSD